MKNVLPLLLVAIAASASLQAATVTLQISNGTNNATGFADAAGSTTAGLTWGIIASADASFAQLPVGLVLSNTSNGIALAGGDFLFLSTNLTVNQTFGAETGVEGKITNIAGISVNDTTINTVSTGYNYAVIWFDRGIAAGSTLVAGSSYGLLTDGNFLIPASGAAANHSANFAATGDPVRRANTITVIPEPSAMLLGAFGALGLLRRRR